MQYNGLYNFLVLLANIARNNIRVYIIQMNLKKIIIYITYLYKFE